MSSKRKVQRVLKYYKNRMKKMTHKSKHWEPLQKCEEFTETEIRELLEKEKRLCGDASDWTEEKMERYVADMKSCEYYRNHLYQVAKYPPHEYAPGWPQIIHLSIKRLDKHPVHDWSHLQQIKNELCGDEYEAIEIYPAESRMVNMANQYHLWVIAEEGVSIPIGFHEGRKVDTQKTGSQSRQRFVDTRTINDD